MGVNHVSGHGPLVPKLGGYFAEASVRMLDFVTSITLHIRGVGQMGDRLIIMLDLSRVISSGAKDELQKINALMVKMVNVRARLRARRDHAQLRILRTRSRHHRRIGANLHHDGEQHGATIDRTGHTRARHGAFLHRGIGRHAARCADRPLDS